MFSWSNQMLFTQEVKPHAQKSATAFGVFWKSVERGEDRGAENHHYGYSLW